jgi:hypothetical protein
MNHRSWPFLLLPVNPLALMLALMMVPLLSPAPAQVQAPAQEPDAHSLCLPTGPPPETGYEPYTGGVVTRGEKVIGGVPGYLWRHGCGPTAAGMVIGYYDGQGFPSLIPGDASTQTSAVSQAIATGSGAATHYSDYSQPIDSSPGPLLDDKSEPPSGDEHPSDCLADFMQTSWSSRNNYYGWAWFSDADNCLLGYVNYVNTAYGAAYQAASWNETWGGFTWTKFKAEIDADRPMVFLVDTDANGSTDHFVTAIGWRDINGYEEYACLDTWNSPATIRWERFRQLGSGVSWGIYGATYFQIEAILPECIVANGSFASGEENWDNQSSGPGLASGIQEIVGYDGHTEVLHLDSRAGADYELLRTQLINVQTCDLADLALSWEWAVPAVEAASGLAEVRLEFYDSDSNHLGSYYIRRHTGDHASYGCAEFIPAFISAHPGVAVGCEQVTGASFAWQYSRVVLDENFFASLQGAVLDPSDVATLRIYLASDNDAGAGADAYFDDVALRSTVPGTIVVDAEPELLAAPWQLNGPDGYSLLADGDTTLTGMAPGSYTLIWLPVPNWLEPSPAQVVQDLPGGGLITFAGTYSGDAGFVDVTTGPLGDGGDSRGAAWGDYDNDGDADLYIVNHNQANRLLRNDGGGLFADVSAAPVADAGPGQAAAWADYDNDGDLDLYLSNLDYPNRLYRNDGAGLFTDVSPWPVADGGPGAAASWVDVDNDGMVDLYLVEDGTSNALFKSYGDFGTGWIFVVSTDAVISDPGAGCGLAWGDYDNDGDQDVYVTNRYQANKLLQNNLALGFFDVTGTGFLANAGNGAGTAWGDYNNDGRLDLYVANDGQADLLLKNAAGGFIQVNGSPLNDAGQCRGVAWTDHDLDGDLDLYLARVGQTDRILQNVGNDGFLPLDIPGTAGSCNGVALCDYDGDGDLDAYLCVDGANKLLGNTFAGGHHWLRLLLVGIESNRTAIGARVRAVAAGRRQIREVTAGSGYMTQHSLPLEFGFGAAEIVDTLRIFWPSGAIQETLQVAVDQTLVMTERDVLTAAGPGPGAAAATRLRTCYPNPFNPSVTISYDLQAAVSVELDIFDVTGRRVCSLKNGDVQAAGRHEVVWRGQDDRGRSVSSGLYYCRLRAGAYARTERLMLVR